MTIGQPKPNKGNRGQGALEYLIILGAAVMIAVVVVGKMMGILGSQSKKMEKDKCIAFLQGLCQALMNPATASASGNAGDAIANYLANHLYDQHMDRLSCSVSTSGSATVSCSVVSSSTTTTPTGSGTGSFSVTYNTLSNTITLGSSTTTAGTTVNVYVHGTKVYFASQPISSNDFACWGGSSSSTTPSTSSSTQSFYAPKTINCNQITAAA